MKKRHHLFLSYSREDSKLAGALERALQARKLRVWLDSRSILAGQVWSAAIEKGIREANGVVVLVTPEIARSEWVAYEYAFAIGAEIPIVAVTVQGAEVPGPAQRFQTAPYTGPRSTAKKIEEGIQAQSRSAGQQRAFFPKLVAKFQEEDGELCRLSGGRTPSLGIDLWIEQAPRQTRSVNFEILDVGFDDRRWTVRRSKRTADPREFLTEEMDSYGDVEIWARGVGSGSGSWLTKSTLYEALIRHYDPRRASPEIRRGLKQIRQN